MMVMTAKVNMKKILTILAAVAGVILALILLLGGKEDPAAQTAADTVSNNDARVEFLSQHGWQVDASPVESGQVRIPQQTTEVFERYNALQKSQGYDLMEYAGKTAMRYVYRINNATQTEEPVYATLLVYKNRIIGGDITDTSPTGTIQGFSKLPSPAPQPTTAPTEATEAQPTQPSQ